MSVVSKNILVCDKCGRPRTTLSRCWSCGVEHCFSCSSEHYVGAGYGNSLYLCDACWGRSSDLRKIIEELQTFDKETGEILRVRGIERLTIEEKATSKGIRCLIEGYEETEIDGRTKTW